MTLVGENYSDFYWNMGLLCSSGDRNYIDEICFSENYFFYRRKYENQFNSISLALGAEINVDITELCPEEFDSNVAAFNNVKSFMNMFPSFVLIKNTCYVAHSNILSQYNIIQKKWMVHMIYAEQITQVIRYKDETQNFQCCIITKKGEVFNNIFTPTKPRT